MANSINTNYGAAIALQNLNNTNAQLQTTQNRINTGQKVSSAKDNGAIFAIATSQRANMGAQDAVKSTFPWAQTLIGSSGAKTYSEVLHGIITKAYSGDLGPKDFYREFRDDLSGDCQLGIECTHVYGSPGCRLDARQPIAARAITGVWLQANHGGRCSLALGHGRR